MPSRYLLFSYDLLRGLSLLFFPIRWLTASQTLAGLQFSTGWIGWRPFPRRFALHPICFGRENAGVIYGWIGASHQLGAALARSEQALSAPIRVITAMHSGSLVQFVSLPVLRFYSSAGSLMHRRLAPFSLCQVENLRKRASSPDYHILTVIMSWCYRLVP